MGREYADDDIRQRYKAFFEGEIDGKDRELTDDQVERLRKKWEDLSEFMKDLKQNFSRFYNRRHNRKGFFWSERFKHHFLTDKEKRPRAIKGLGGLPAKYPLPRQSQTWKHRFLSLLYQCRTMVGSGRRVYTL